MATAESSVPPSATLISQGAEALVYSIPTFFNISTSLRTDEKHNMPCVLKRRFHKSYRHPTLDAKIIKSRTKAEVKAMVKCRKFGVSVPNIYHVDLNNEKDGCSIYMEHIYGLTVREVRKNIVVASTMIIWNGSVRNLFISAEHGIILLPHIRGTYAVPSKIRRRRPSHR